MGRFWIEDDFIRKYAKNLSIYAQMVYITLLCHANTDGITFIGYRKIANLIRINKNTAYKAFKELEATHWVGRLPSKEGQPTHFRIHTDPSGNPLSQKATHLVGHKEDIIKEDIKEGKKFFYKGREQMEEAKNNILKKANSVAFKKLYGNAS